MIKKRYLHSSIEEDLKNKMVFLGGPRQVGKTTLSKEIGKEGFKTFSYFNWDSRQDRDSIIKNQFPSEAKLLIFDEIHKYKNWKNYLKGEFDKNKEKYSILATGSARLNVYRKGGDSLMGRYHYYRLHPFSLRELLVKDKISLKAGKEPTFLNEKGSGGILKDLFTFGGFPEPFSKKNRRTLRRFHNERLELLVKEDIRDLEGIRDLSALQILVEILPEKVGSLFSINSIKEDLGVTHKTASAWMDVLERFYYHFRIYPFATNKIRSLRKEPKLYLWDWSQVKDEGRRFENLVASHLLKTVDYLYDREGIKADISFLRDVDQREVDFLVSINKKPWMAVETKTSFDGTLSKNLLYFMKKIQPPFVYQVVKEEGIDFTRAGVRVISANKFLSGLI